jgi:hypothetical protein
VNRATPTYLVTGGSHGLAETLQEALPDAQILSLASAGSDASDAATSSRAALRVEQLPEVVESIAGWIHAVPATTSAPSAFAESAALFESWQLADVHLREGSRASFIAVLPSPGLFVDPYELGVSAAAGMARSLQCTRAQDWSQRGICFNSITYGGLERFAPAGQRTQDEIVGRIPMGRLGSIGDLVNAIRFLTSEAASYVASADLRIDGGMEAYSWFYPVTDI